MHYAIKTSLWSLSEILACEHGRGDHSDLNMVNQRKRCIHYSEKAARIDTLSPFGLGLLCRGLLPMILSILLWGQLAISCEIRTGKVELSLYFCSIFL